MQQLLRQRGKNPNRLEEEEYKLVFLKVYKLMMPAADYVEAEARLAVKEDWVSDSAGRGYLTRETFIDQTLVHRVVEPQKAFRWLMLSDTCYGSPPVCRAMRNLTHGLPVELPPWWKTAPEAARRIVYEATERLRGGQTAAAPAAGGGGGSHSWLTDAVPDHHPRAFTGVQAEQCC